MEKNLKIIVQKLEDGFNNRIYIKQKNHYFFILTPLPF